MQRETKAQILERLKKADEFAVEVASALGYCQPDGPTRDMIVRRAKELVADHSNLEKAVEGYQTVSTNQEREIAALKVSRDAVKKELVVSNDCDIVPMIQRLKVQRDDAIEGEAYSDGEAEGLRDALRVMFGRDVPYRDDD